MAWLIQIAVLLSILYIPTKVEPCEWKTMRRHHAKRCSMKQCEKCKTSQCAMKKCGRKKSVER